MFVATIVVGRDGDTSTAPVISVPSGYVLDWVGDYSTDTYPSMMAIYHKVVHSILLEPATQTFGVTPARSLSVEMLAVKDSVSMTLAVNTDYSGNPGDPQSVRDAGVIATGTLPSAGALEIAWYAAAGFGPTNEFGRQYSLQSILATLDRYSTTLFTAGTYFVSVSPWNGVSWITSEATVDLRITRTSEIHSIGRRPIAAPTLDTLTDTVAGAVTITDPPIGTTLIRTNVTTFHDNTENPGVIARFSSGGANADYVAWQKLVLTQDMWLAFDTFGSAMLDTLLAVFVGTPNPTTVQLNINDDSGVMPYAGSNDFLVTAFGGAGSSGFGAQQPDFYVQQGYVLPRLPSDLTSSVINVYPDQGSPRRVGVMMSFAASISFFTQWPYVPGSVLVNGSTSGVIELNPATGQVAMSPAPTGTLTVTYQSAGSNPFDIYPVPSTGTADVSVLLGNGTVSADM